MDVSASAVLIMLWMFTILHGKARTCFVEWRDDGFSGSEEYSVGGELNSRSWQRQLASELQEQIPISNKFGIQTDGQEVTASYGQLSATNVDDLEEYAKGEGDLKGDPIVYCSTQGCGRENIKEVKIEYSDITEEYNKNVNDFMQKRQLNYMPNNCTKISNEGNTLKFRRKSFPMTEKTSVVKISLPVEAQIEGSKQVPACTESIEEQINRVLVLDKLKMITQSLEQPNYANYLLNQLFSNSTEHDIAFRKHNNNDNTPSLRPEGSKSLLKQNKEHYNNYFITETESLMSKDSQREARPTLAQAYVKLPEEDRTLPTNRHVNHSLAKSKLRKKKHHRNVKQHD